MTRLGAIDGVVIKPLTVHKDIPDRPNEQSRGYLMEIVRATDGLLDQFCQSTMSVTHHGTIKAFHWHKKQEDLWCVVTGKANIVLYDRRKNSKTHGITQQISAGQDDYKLVLIPRGVAHGYQVLSKEPVILFYHTNQCYDANHPDEQRIAWDDPTIGYNWL